ncbi:MAG: hypothetical protein FWF15_00655 [Oscillospiraceae bacterium]|nr:hypothetical protein [Oscillospiraceae bacterium]
MKNLISIMLILTFLLVSCASGSDDKPNSNNPGVSNNSAEETTPEFKPITDNNFSGGELRLIGPGTAPVVWDYAACAVINEVAVETESGEPINDAVYRRNREVEELYNIKIVPSFPGDDRGTFERYVRNSFLSAEDTYDIAFIIGFSARQTILTNNSYTYDLLTFPNLDLKHSWWDQRSIADLSVAKQLHMVAGDINIFSAFSVDHLFQNKAMVDEYKLENAYDLVRNGKWTYDKIIEMSRQVSRDLDGDGEMTIEDQYGICCETANMRAITISSGARLTQKDSDDIPILTINSEKTISVFEYALKSFMDKSIAILANDHSGKFKDIWNDKLLPKFRNNEFLFINLPMLYSLDFRNMESDFGILPYPKLSEQQPEYHTLVGMYFATYVYIPTTATNTEMVGAALDALGYYSQVYVRPALIDTTVTDKLIRDNDSAEMIDLLLNTRVYELGVLYNWGDLMGTLLYPVAQKRVNEFASNYAKNEEKIKSEIEKTISEMLE